MTINIIICIFCPFLQIYIPSPAIPNAGRAVGAVAGSAPGPKPAPRSTSSKSAVYTEFNVLLLPPQPPCLSVYSKSSANPIHWLRLPGSSVHLSLQVHLARAFWT